MFGERESYIQTRRNVDHGMLHINGPCLRVSSQCERERESLNSETEESWGNLENMIGLDWIGLDWGVLCHYLLVE